MIIQYVRADSVPEGARVLVREFPAVFLTVTRAEPAAERRTRLHYAGVPEPADHLSSELLRCDLATAADAVVVQLDAAAARLAPLLASRRGASLHNLTPTDADAGLDKAPLSVLFRAR